MVAKPAKTAIVVLSTNRRISYVIGVAFASGLCVTTLFHRSWRAALTWIKQTLPSGTASNVPGLQL
jgi:hypothetical protein